jgi:hypothetical protein
MEVKISWRAMLCTIFLSLEKPWIVEGVREISVEKFCAYVDIWQSVFNLNGEYSRNIQGFL